MKKYILPTIILILCSAIVSAQELPNFMNRNSFISPEINSSEVTFRIKAPNAREINLYGSWMPNRTDSESLVEKKDSLWEVTLPLPEPDIYTYHFIIDGIVMNDAANVLMQRDGTRYLSMLFYVISLVMKCFEKEFTLQVRLILDGLTK